MRKILLALAAVLALASCGDDNTEDAQDNSAERMQNEAFANVQNEIVGEWHTAKFYNDGTYSDYWGKPVGWLDIDTSKNNVAYLFKSDGSFTEAGGEVGGTYEIYKNPYYTLIPNYTVPTYIELDYHKTGISPTKYGITIDNNGYMRLYSLTNIYGTEYADFDSYPANYQHLKR